MSQDKTIKLLENIQKLLVLGLITRKVQAKDIAKTLGIGKSSVNRMVPARQIKKNNQ